MPGSTNLAERREARVVGIVALAVLAIVIVRTALGTNFYDGAYYVVVPLRIARGARLLADEMALQAFGSLVAVPFVKVWTALFGLTAISLAVELFYVALASVAAFFCYRLLRPTLRPAAAALAVGLPLLAPPYHLIAPSYNTVAELAFLLATCLAFAALRDENRAYAAGFGVALVVGTIAYPPLVFAALAFFAMFAAFAWHAPRLIGASLLAGIGTAAVCAAALFSAVSVAEVRAAIAFATANVGHIGSPVAKLRYYAGNSGRALFQPLLLPMWVLALVATPPFVPRRLRAVALATIPLAAALPGAVLVAKADDFTFGTAAATWYLIFSAGILLPVLVWAIRTRRKPVLRLMALTAPFAVIGYLTIAYSTNSSWHRGVPVIVVAAFGIGLVAGWVEALADAGGAWSLSLGPALALVAIVGLLYSTLFGDAGLLLPHTFVLSGPYAGLVTSVDHAQDIRDLSAAGREWVRPNDRVLFLGIKDGYLLVGGQIDTNAVWLPPQASDSSAIGYFSRPGNHWPDVVFVDDTAISDDGGIARHAALDPLFARIKAEYHLVGTVAGFSVYRRGNARDEGRSAALPSPGARVLYPLARGVWRPGARGELAE